MRVFHRVRVQDPRALGGAVINAPGELDRSLPPLEQGARSALVSALREAASQPTDASDTLAQRLLEGLADEADRRAGPVAVGLIDTSDAESSESTVAPKHVVLRGSTQSARRRRHLIQAQRHSTDDLGVDPPPD